MIATLGEALGKPVRIKASPRATGRREKDTYADVSLARRELGYEPKTTLAEGLARFVEWSRAEGHRMSGLT